MTIANVLSRESAVVARFAWCDPLLYSPAATGRELCRRAGEIVEADDLPFADYRRATKGCIDG